MITNASCTLYHEVGDGYERQYFPRCSWIQTQGAGPGLDPADEVAVRIPTAKDVALRCGDLLVKGQWTEEEPPKGAFTVKAYSDNRYGLRSTWHWKIVGA